MHDGNVILIRPYVSEIPYAHNSRSIGFCAVLRVEYVQVPGIGTTVFGDFISELSSTPAGATVP